MLEDESIHRPKTGGLHLVDNWPWPWPHQATPKISEAHRHFAEAEDKAEFLATLGLRRGFPAHGS